MKILTWMLYLSTGIILALGELNDGNTQSEVKRFPDGFLFGSATAAYQVEGAWNVGGKSESTWDYTLHKEPWRVVNEDNGDIACDSYNNYKRDVEMLRELGVNTYRFSLSWTRILPTGFANYFAEDGVAYYNNLIDELLKYNILPIITLYHWDLPQRLQDLGGWTNPLIVDWYTDYARVAFELFGDRVQNWVTMNEAHGICTGGYEESTLTPYIDSQGIGNYLCAYNLLKAHSSAYHLYDEDFRPSQGGRIGISTDMMWAEAASDSEDDVIAAQDFRDFYHGLYTHAIFNSNGDFPPRVKELVAAKSAQQGFPRSRLPEFTPQEVEYIKGTADFFGMNHYSTIYIYRNESVVGLYEQPSLYDDMNTNSFTDPSWDMDAEATVKSVPWGFRKVLNYIKNTFNDPPIWIMENGYSTLGGVEDDARVNNYRSYLVELLNAIHEDGVNVIGYMAWSLMDNFEWGYGYGVRYGLYEVDFTDPARTRTARKSAVVYKEIIRSGVVDMDYEPDSLDISLNLD